MKLCLNLFLVALFFLNRFNLLEATTAGADVTPELFAVDADIVNITAIAANAAIDVELLIAATAND